MALDEDIDQENFPCCSGEKTSCLGMVDWDCCGARAPSPKKAKPLSLRQQLSPRSRFREKVQPAKLASLAKGYTPANTAKSTDWSVNNFSCWLRQRNSRSAESDKCPEDVLTNPESAAVLCHWLGVFVIETRRLDGSRYCPKTLYLILCGLLRFMPSNNPAAYNFLEFHNVCDSLFRELHQEGLGTEKETAVITKDEENQLWKSGILGLHSPKLRTVFFYVGKLFCLRGREEHRALKASQLKRLQDPDRYVYTEHGSKNRSGGLSHMKVKNKVVPVIANPANGDRCLVRILDFYLAKLPDQATLKEDLFYMQPLPAVPADSDAPWFKKQAVGKNTLGNMVNFCPTGNVVINVNPGLSVEEEFDSICRDVSF